MTPRTHRVVSRRRETEDTWTLALEPLPGQKLPLFAPGQFGMLYAFGAGEVPISVSGAATALDPLRCTVRAVGSVSSTLCATAPGDLVGLRGPYGSKWPLAEAVAGDVVIVAGGLGLAPLRPAIHHVLAHRNEYERVIVCYGGRSAAEMLFVYELEEWRGRFDLDVDVIVDIAGPTWHGKVGVVTKLVELAAFDPREHDRDDVRAGGDASLRCADPAGAWRYQRARVHLDGAQHALCDRAVRPLPVRTGLHLP